MICHEARRSIMLAKEILVLVKLTKDHEGLRAEIEKNEAIMLLSDFKNEDEVSI